jgi:hypothetical protein
MKWVNNDNKELFENKENYIGKLFVNKDNKQMAILLSVELKQEESYPNRAYVDITFLIRNSINYFEFMYSSWQENYDEIV